MLTSEHFLISYLESHPIRILFNFCLAYFMNISICVDFFYDLPRDIERSRLSNFNIVYYFKICRHHDMRI